jgi:hypothetical protein
VPRPPPSIPLGGSLRASRAAQLARPDGPLAAVDLADGRALVAVLRDAVWVELAADEAALALPQFPPVPDPAPAAAPQLRSRRRAGALVALAAAVGAACAAFASGFSGPPAPAVAGQLVRVPIPQRLRAHPPPLARGGRAGAPPRRAPASAARPAPSRAPPAVAAPVAVASPAPAATPAPGPAPAPPALPELPAAPAL